MRTATLVSRIALFLAVAMLATAAERDIAEWAIRRGGRVVIEGSREPIGDLVSLPSGEIRMVDARCRATVGEVGNPERELVSLGKAGRNRWLGVRPSVRGVAMNPVDHPLGGGEGKSSGGRNPTSPWGKKEGRTRKPKPSDKLIVRRRGKRRG